MADYLPVAPQFDISYEGEVYLERIKHFFRVNPGVLEERHTAILLKV